MIPKPLMPRIALSSCDPALNEQARLLALALDISLCSQPCEDFDFILALVPEGAHYRLELRETGSKGSLYIDFIGGTLGYRSRHGGGRNQPLGRAVGLKGGALPSIIDATAGLGRDAFVLANLGCSVTLIERSPIVAALLRNGLMRGMEDSAIGKIIRDRMRLVEGDAITYLSQLDEADCPDVIYLDPMYPHRDKSALVKKEMRWLRRLVGDDQDIPRLLDTARSRARKRVVVKRPRLAPQVEGPEPTLVIASENTRFDVYLVQA